MPPNDPDILAELDEFDDDEDLPEFLEDLVDELELNAMVARAAPLPKQPTITAPFEPEPEPELEQPAPDPHPEIIPPDDGRWSDAKWAMTHQRELREHAQARIARGDFG